MKIRYLIPGSLCLAAIISSGAQAEFTMDGEAHQACIQRFESINHQHGLGLREAATYEAPATTARRYHYFFNANARREDQSPGDYRVECKANQHGKVTYFALEPGQWRYQHPETDDLATR